MLESLFNNFIKWELQPSCFPMKFATFLGIPILKNICKRLLMLLLLTRRTHLHLSIAFATNERLHSSKVPQHDGH